MTFWSSWELKHVVSSIATLVLTMSRIFLVWKTSILSKQGNSEVYRKPRLSTNVRIFDEVWYLILSSWISFQPMTESCITLADSSMFSVKFWPDSEEISPFLFSSKSSYRVTRRTIEPPYRPESSSELSTLFFISSDISVAVNVESGSSIRMKCF